MISTTQHAPSSSTSGSFQPDVVLVEAGPVGRALACALVTHGLRHRVFDERTEPRTTSRANNLWARPQEPLAGVDGAAHDRSHLRGTPALVLVRPDGHIAFRAPAGRGDLLQQYLSRVGAGARADAAGAVLQ